MGDFISNRQDFAHDRLFISQLLDAIPDVIFIMNLHTRELLFSNRSVATMLGYTKSDIEDFEHPLFSIMYPEDIPRMQNHLHEMIVTKDKLVFETESRLIDKVGRVRWFKDKNVVFKRDSSGTPIEKLGIAQEITDKKTSQKDLERAREQIGTLNEQLMDRNRELEFANSELKAFNAVAANDYQDTLRKLYTSLEYIVMNDAKGLSNEGRANIRRAQSAVQKMKLLTDDIINYTSISIKEQRRLTVSIDRVINEVLAGLQDRISKHCATIAVEGCFEIYAYPLLLRVLVHNLVSNALKFNESSPTIKIICSEIHGEEIPFEHTNRAAVYHQMMVTDDGIGFDPADAENIFDVFYKSGNNTKYKGSGLGLAISKKIMEIHEGFIKAIGEPGNGAKFICYFPKKEKLNSD